MIEDQLDTLLTAAAPVTDEQLRLVPSALEDAAADLRERVVGTPYQEEAPAPVRSARPRWGRRIGAVAAALLVFAAAFAVLGQRGGEDGTAWASEQVAYAEASPLLLVDGWTVVRADQQPGFGGDMRFASSDRHVDLTWRADGQEPIYVREMIEIEVVATIDAAGSEVTVYRFTDPLSEHEYRAVWKAGGETLELGGSAPDDATFLRAVESLRRVDADTWLSAMPASIVQGIDRSRVVAEMLADIDVPPGFDPSALTSDRQVRDRYQLGARVTSAVACGWLDRWEAAHATGDQQGMDEASAAMAASHDWKVLADMESEGRWPESVWEVADSMAAGRPSTGGGAGPGTGDARTAMGCEDS